MSDGLYEWERDALKDCRLALQVFLFSRETFISGEIDDSVRILIKASVSRLNAVLEARKASEKREINMERSL